MMTHAYYNNLRWRCRLSVATASNGRQCLAKVSCGIKNFLNQRQLSVQNLSQADLLHDMTMQPTEYIFYWKREILFFSSSKILTPHPPLRPASLSSPRNKGGVTNSPGGEGDGGSIFWKTREIGLSSYSKICTLWCNPTEQQRSQALCMTVRRQHQKNFVILSWGSRHGFLLYSGWDLAELWLERLIAKCKRV
jgi:hypothetical protein